MFGHLQSFASTACPFYVTGLVLTAHTLLVVSFAHTKWVQVEVKLRS